MWARGVAAVFCVCLGVCVAALTQQKTEGDECRTYCSSTYPEHTYPNADAHMACARGCRIAQVEALMAWPLSPPPEKCAQDCLEAYLSHSDETFACKFGCDATTISTLTSDQANSSSSETEESVLDSFMGLFSVAFLLVLDDDMDTLREQAQQLSSFGPSLSHSRITVVIEEGGEETVDWVSYSVNGMVIPLPKNDVILDYDFSGPTKGAGGNIYSFDDDDFPYSRYCPWRHFRNSPVRRILMAASVGVIMFSMLVCVCLACGPSRENKSHSSKVEKRKMEERPLIPLSDVKAPLDLSSEYGPPHPIVLPVRFSTVRSKTVEGILTVV